MAKLRVFQLGGMDLRVSPMLQQPGELLRSVNVDSGPYGAKVKRPGYTTYLGTANGGTVVNMFEWHQDNGTTFWNYANFNGTLFYSSQGTADWVVCGNGTFTAGSYIGHAVQKNTMIMGDGASATRHTTNGTSFTNTSAAPQAQYWTTFQNRAYCGGTSSILAYSVSNDITNWNTSGTSDSSSINISGEGKTNQLYTANNRVVINKTSQNMFRWDGYNLVQIPTNKGLRAPQSLGSIEDTWFSLMNDGFTNYNGDRPELLSLPIGKQIRNDASKGIVGTMFDNATGIAHQYKYLCEVGTVTDDLILGTIPDCIEVYDFINNEWSNYKFNDRPAAWLTFKDNTQTQQLVFASGSQCYQYGGTVTNDNGAPIESVIEGVLHFGAPESDKEHKRLWAFFNPGAQAKIQVAMANTFTYAKLQWVDLGDCSDGVVEFAFPSGSRSKLLFWKVYEASRNARFDFYGFSWEGEVLDKK